VVTGRIRQVAQAMVKTPSVFEHGEGEVFDGAVRQGVIARHREELDFA